MPYSLRARRVYPIDRPPIDDGIVAIDGDAIVAVDTAKHATGIVRDLGDVALLPAFVNAHTHLEFSHLAAPLGRLGMPLIEWLPLAIAERQKRGHSAEKSIALGLQESVLAGSCAVGEIATASASAYPIEIDTAVVQFQEVIGFSRARAESAFAAVEQRLAAAQAALDELQRLDGPPALGLSPHAPYTVSPELVGRLMQRATKHRLPVAMHLAESAEEIEFLATAAGPFRQLLEARSMWDPAAIPPGTRPLDYLQMLAAAPRALVIHGNYLTSLEHEFLSAHADRMTLVFCPRTHHFFAHPRYPLAELLQQGVAVALGTDSRASNPDLDLLGEVRHVAQNYPEVSGEAIVAMATLHGARALGCETRCGSLTRGKQASLVALPLVGDSLSETLAAVARPAAIWISGREV